MRTNREVTEAGTEAALVREYLPLVHHVVASTRGRLPHHVNAEDLTSAAMVGLFNVARAFDPERGIPFPAYATTWIRGAILDELRDGDWASAACGHGHVRCSEVDATGRGLREAAASVGLTEEDARQVMADVERASLVSFDGVMNADALRLAPVAEDSTPEHHLLEREVTGYLRDAVESLPPRLRHVVVATYFDERPMAEIGEELGVSESRVSHMRAEGLSLIRQAMSRILDARDEATEITAPSRPGVAAQRRNRYCDTVASASDYRSRLEKPMPTVVAATA